jgi:hypothetical protein
MKGTAKLLMAIAIINMSLILVSPVKATIFYGEHGGTASTEYDEYSEPLHIEAKYTTHTLKLGVYCALPGQEGTAKGSMYVWGQTTYTGWVTGTVKWYMKGCILCSLINGRGLKAHVIVKFRAVDTTANHGVEKVIFNQYVTWTYVEYNGEYGGSMSIPLYSGHWYQFFLDVEVHAENWDSLLSTDAYADFCGFPGHPSDYRIEWRYMDIPNVSPPGGGGCPTLFVWDGAEYVDEGVLDIHAESDVTVQHEIQNTLALEKGVYKIQLRELDGYTSHIDLVKLYSVDYKGEWHLCPLTYAYHSELGKVKQTLLLDDSNRVNLNPTEIIDLRFEESECETAYFIFEINGYNMKVP